MFEKIKKNLFKFFNSSWNREKNKKLEDKRKKYKKVSGVL